MKITPKAFVVLFGSWYLMTICKLKIIQAYFRWQENSKLRKGKTQLAHCKAPDKFTFKKSGN